MPPFIDPITGNVPGLIYLILLLAVPLALTACLIVLLLYRSAVLRGMRRRAPAGTPQPAPPQTAPSPSEPLQSSLDIAVFDPSVRTPHSPPTDRFYFDLLKGPWQAARIYALAGLCYALVESIVFLIATQSRFDPLGFLFLLWYYAWPVAITVSLVAAGTRRARWTVFGSYFLFMVLLGVVAALTGSLLNWAGALFLWVTADFPAALLLSVFLNRRIQAAGPFALIFMVFIITGMLLVPPLVLDNADLLARTGSLGAAVGLDTFSLYILLLGTSFVLFGAVAWMLLLALSSRYQNSRTSAQSILVDAIWLLFVIFHATDLLFEGGGWFLISLLSFLVYKIVLWAGFSLAARKAPPGHKCPDLLLLRVFSLGKRSERLFDLLAMHWRYAGRIRLIAGPDLATSTMEPHEFLEFLSGKLSRRFIDSPRTLELRLAQDRSEPDHDGQFRVSDFFCYDDTWRMVLSRLVGTSHVVLMDLRGFSPRNAGCIFEINELINSMPLRQVLLIVDQTTDEAFLRQVLQKSWEQMKSTSPNRLAKAPSLSLCRLKGLGDRELEGLFQVLSQAVKAAPAA